MYDKSILIEILSFLSAIKYRTKEMINNGAPTPYVVLLDGYPVEIMEIEIGLVVITSEDRLEPGLFGLEQAKIIQRIAAESGIGELEVITSLEYIDRLETELRAEIANIDAIEVATREASALSNILSNLSQTSDRTIN